MEIKKAFETFKKDLAKETNIKGGFTMSAKQIKLRTATYLSTSLTPFEDQIARVLRDDERVQGYDTWTDEEKGRHHNEALSTVAWYKERLEKFKTPRNLATYEMCSIVASEAFRKLQDEIGQISVDMEDKNGYAYIRFNY